MKGQCAAQVSKKVSAIKQEGSHFERQGGNELDKSIQDKQFLLLELMFAF